MNTTFVYALLSGIGGAGIAFLGVQLQLRAQLKLASDSRDTERLRVERTTAHEEARAAISAFLAAAQQAERAVVGRYDDRERAQPTGSAEAMDGMWVQQKLTQVFCSERLASAAYSFTELTHLLLWREPRSLEDVWHELNERRDEFLVAAQEEMKLNLLG